MSARRTEFQLALDRFVQHVQGVASVAVEAHVDLLDDAWANAVDSRIQFAAGEAQKLGASLGEELLKKVAEAENLGRHLTYILKENPSYATRPSSEWYTPRWERIVNRLLELIQELRVISQKQSRQERRRDQPTPQELKAVRKLYRKKPEAQLKDIRGLGMGGTKAQICRDVMRQEGLDQSRPRKRRKK